MPAKKQRGVLARLKDKIGIKDDDKLKPKKPAPKTPTSYPAGGYGNPEPRKKRMEEIFNFGLRKKK